MTLHLEVVDSSLLTAPASERQTTSLSPTTIIEIGWRVSTLDFETIGNHAPLGNVCAVDCLFSVGLLMKSIQIRYKKFTKKLRKVKNNSCSYRRIVLNEENSV